MVRKRRETTDDEEYQNGEISLREFIMAVTQADIGRLEGMHNADVKRLEAIVLSESAKTKINTDAIKESMVTADSITRERLESHNKFREQIEKERADLVRKEDLARVEREMSMRFESMQDKTEAALQSTQRALKESESRLEQSFSTRDKAIAEIKEDVDTMSGKWTAQTVALAVITIGFTAMSIVLYVLSGK
ncbi:MAG: hypothetical protein EHM35_05150 [Planctomycetaceae bacterium]|nr:MAG: hypothetical protein EHM35_05150 [Planctomycetaceae bacterium]